MKIIAHRGNISGRDPENENRPSYILDAIWLGYEVEVDVWWQQGQWFLGHDSPEYSISSSFLENKKLWCHAKNFLAFKKMLKNKNIHCFWHQTDDYALTSKGYIWTYPGKTIDMNSVIVKPEENNFIINSRAYGVCTNFSAKIKDMLGENS